MDKTGGNLNEQANEKHKNRQSIIESMIPPGLSGQIRDKARDALMTAMVILGMSRTDIQDCIQEIAKENGLTPQSARVWLLFGKEMSDRAQAVGTQVGNEGRKKTFSQNLGYGRNDTQTLGLDAVFRRGATGTGIGKDAADDMRAELNREAGHHANSLSGKGGVFSYDQMVDGWGKGGGGQGLDDAASLDDSAGPDDAASPGEAAGLEKTDGETEMDFNPEWESEEGLDAGTGPEEFRSREEEDPDADKTAGRTPGWHTADHQDVFHAGAMATPKNRFVPIGPDREERAKRSVAALERKMGGFRGTDAEFAAFAQANPDLDKNDLRLLRKGMSDKNYLGFRVYQENGQLLDNKGRGGDRVSTQTRACLLMVSEDSARSAQNTMRAQARLFSRLPDPGMEKVSIGHAMRMAKPFSRLVDEYATNHPKRVEKYKESLTRDKKTRKEPDPGLER